MDYESFKKWIIGHLQKWVGDSSAVQLHQVLKNNSTKLDGLTIFSSDQCISPTVYLNEYFTSYQKGRTAESILTEIQDIFSSKSAPFHFSLEQLEDFSSIRPRICFRLINAAWNQELLETIPFLPFLDLAVVFYYHLEGTAGESATVLVTNDLMRLWHVETKDLSAAALENTPAAYPWECRQVFTLLNELVPELPIPFAGGPDDRLYVLTSKNRCFGAACLLYPGVLKMISEGFEKNLFLLPSSIHEFLILTDDGTATAEDLSQLVAGINEEELDPADRLADHIYYYDRKKQVLLLSPGESRAEGISDILFPKV